MTFIDTLFPRSVIIIDFFLSYFIISSFRISKRITLEKSPKSQNRAVVIGANAKSANIIKSSLNGDIDYSIVAIFDSDKNVVGTYFNNIKVYSLDEMEKISTIERSKSALISKEFTSKELDSIFEKLYTLGYEEIKLIKFFEDEKIKDISIEDLLAREPKDLDSKKIREFIEGKSILVTGAGGSIGSEISRLLEAYGAKELILVENCEYNLYKICEELKIKRVAKLISVLDLCELEELFKKHTIDIVIHAAAYKHVPLCEENHKEAVKNNIFGSKNIIDLSIKYGVKKVVIISTDKAVRPTNIMGATKRVVELYAQNVTSKESEIVCVRFGNVLGSSGSVIPKFKELIDRNENLKVTHPDITRYFMLIPEACELVLQASAIARGGEIFILDMGEPVKILDLAKKMLKLYKKEGRLGIDFIGLRAGEKLYEELLIDESEKKTEYESIHVARPISYDIDILKTKIEELALGGCDIESKLREIVPEFKRVKKGDCDL